MALSDEEHSEFWTKLFTHLSLSSPEFRGSKWFKEYLNTKLVCEFRTNISLSPSYTNTIVDTITY